MRKKIDVRAAIALILYGPLAVAFYELQGDVWWVRMLVGGLAGLCFATVARATVRVVPPPR